MNKDLYRLYTVVNYADTHRDPDDIRYTDLGSSKSLKEAKKVAEEYIKEHFIFKDRKIFRRDEDTWVAEDSGSYAKTLVIERIMNERIRELGKEAGYLPDMFGLYHFDMPEFKKFVRLIAKECSSIVRESDGHNEERLSDIADYIEEHFGVK